MAAAFLICRHSLSPAQPVRSELSQKTNDLGAFQIEPGFRLDLVAAEPVVESPAAMAFDEEGRLFVAEMRDYPAGRDAHPHLGRIRLLEDPDGTGVFNASRVYATDLAWPSAIACYDGGVFVAATPEILYFRDSKRDGAADVRQVAFTGFGGPSFRPVASLLLNSFQWGLDNRIHGCAADLGGPVVSFNAAGSPPLPLNEGDFSFDPRTREILPEAGPGRSGLAFDDRGRKFVCGFSSPLELAVFNARYADRNAFFPVPRELIDVAPTATPVFLPPPLAPPGSPAPRLPSPRPASGGKAAPNGWLAAWHGCLICRGGAYPPEYIGNAFIADPQAHMIHRMLLRDTGTGVVAERPPNESQSEFLVSADPAFRPSQIVNGPDGVLYVADMRGGGHEGRIYRIAPVGFKPRPAPRLDGASSYDLIAALAQTNGWLQDTAARLLFERRELGAARFLGDMLSRARLPLARLRALGALDGSGNLTEARLLTALSDSDERVRELAVRLSESWVKANSLSDSLRDQLANMVEDTSPAVRYQLAFTLGEVGHPAKARLLARLLLRDQDNVWMRAAVSSSVDTGAADLLTRLASDARFRNQPRGLEVLRQLADMIGVAGQLNEVNQAWTFVDSGNLEAAPTYAILDGLGYGLTRTGSSLAMVDPNATLQRFFNQAGLDAGGAGTLEPTTLDEIRLLGAIAFKLPDNSDWLLGVIGSGQVQPIQSAAIAAIAHSDDALLTDHMLSRWPFLTPLSRTEAVTTLLRRDSRVPQVLAALEKGRIQTSSVAPAQIQFLRTFPDDVLSARAVRIFGPVSPPRADVVAAFQPALRMNGDATRGSQLFLDRCSACHNFSGNSRSFGPNLAVARIRGRENLLKAILDPNGFIWQGYETTVLVTKDGENRLGVVSGESDATVTFSQPDGTREVWPRDNLQPLQRQPWSLMPEGLAAGLSQQDMADLIEYVMTAPQ